MPAEIRVMSPEDFIQSGPDGSYDYDATKAFLYELVAAAAREGNPRLLIDTRDFVASEIEITDVFDLVTHARSLQLGAKSRVAIVNRPKDEFDRAKLFEIGAASRGLQVLAFRDYDEALAWLGED